MRAEAGPTDVITGSAQTRPILATYCAEPTIMAPIGALPGSVVGLADSRGRRP
jgi:hypothetical protein